MSKSERENLNAVLETTVGSHSGVSSTSVMLRTNVNEHVEKKNGLSYLSWAWAWAEVLKVDNQAWFEVHEWWLDEGGTVPCMYLKDQTAMVKVSVYVNEIKRTCVLPVMDHRNKAIENPNAFQVNTAIMRCLAKAIAMHGLGLYIYAGEDLPMEEEVKEEKVEKKEIPQQDKNDLTLFADGLLEYLKIAKDEKGLKSYWKSNQTNIDKLKASMPDLYEIVLEKFKQAREAFKEQA